MNQGPSYYGDLDEVDGKLLKYEQEAEDKGAFNIAVPLLLHKANINSRVGRSLFEFARIPWPA